MKIQQIYHESPKTLETWRAEQMISILYRGFVKKIRLTRVQSKMEAYKEVIDILADTETFPQMGRADFTKDMTRHNAANALQHISKNCFTFVEANERLHIEKNKTSKTPIHFEDSSGSVLPSIPIIPNQGHFLVIGNDDPENEQRYAKYALLLMSATTRDAEIKKDTNLDKFATNKQTHADDDDTLGFDSNHLPKNEDKEEIKKQKCILCDKLVTKSYYPTHLKKCTTKNRNAPNEGTEYDEPPPGWRKKPRIEMQSRKKHRKK